MGVTLERVQNKFACIIGELCSEPDILSEFAIWLDLRLAEYKAKGAIQLECSGETPDPTWLRGHKQPPKRIKTPKMERLHHFDSAPEYNEDMSHEVSERLSPEIVVVKEEMGDGNDIFPVSIHRHDVAVSNRNHARKRSPADASSNKHSSENSPFKMQRLSPSSSVLEPVNQSLMSIISENTADDSADMSANLSADFSTLESPNIDNSSYVPSSNPVASTSGGESMDQQDGSNSVPDRRCKANELLSANTRNPVWHTPISYPPVRKIHSISKKVKARILNVDSKSNTTIGNLVGAVSKLENWLVGASNEHRNIEDIPPAELDNYLVVFFSILKNRHGQDYDPESFSNFRSFLERFLKEQGYPVSISGSTTFSNSQAVYNDKRKALMKIAVERRKVRHQQHMYYMSAQIAAMNQLDEPQNLSMNP